MNRPRLIMAGLSGGSGKTVLTLGLCRALLRMGRKIKPYKKGPDYIDAVWLGLASRASATNLDPFLMDWDTIHSLFLQSFQSYDLGIIEGNRGLFDGKDVSGVCSTAELARRLKAPVVLIIDCTKMTRTTAAIVAGCMNFEPNVPLAGVILNRTAGNRHRKVIRECIKEYTGIPVLGEVPKIPENPIPERHMGLISSREYAGTEAVLENLADIAEAYLDIPALIETAQSAPMLSTSTKEIWPLNVLGTDDSVRIGYVRDAALWFYYEENLEALRRAGAELVELSLFSQNGWSDIHGLYLGGGFPETQAETIASREDIRKRILDFVENAMPVYAECGGFMLLGRGLHCDQKYYPMAGVFPVETVLCDKPQGLGYVSAEVVEQNPYYEIGEHLQGHEFHYSKCTASGVEGVRTALRMTRGSGMMQGKDGLIYKNTFASYTHIHALGMPKWAERFVSAAKEYKEK